MKNKLFSIFTALAMVLGVLVAPFTSAHAADATETKSVTIHKILLSKKQLEEHDKDKKYNGKEITDLKGFFAEKWKEGDHVPTEIDGVYFKLQKLNDGVTDIDVTKDEQWTDVAGKDGKTEGGAGLTLDTTGLKGTYRIVEDLTKSTYKGDKGELLAASKAVPTLLTLPIENNEGIVENAHVYPKNTQEKPKIDKNFSVEEAKKHISEEEATKLDTAIQHKVAFDNAKKSYAETTDEYKKAAADYTPEDKELIAKWGIDFDDNQRTTKQEVTKKIGDNVGYVVETEIPKDAKYKKLVWNDNMTKGLTYNKDLKIEGAGLADEDYTIIATDRGFTLVLKESGLTKVENAAKTADVTLKLTYSAKVNENSIVDTADLNDIALDYSNLPGKDNEPKEFTPGRKEITMKKSWDVTGDQEVTEADKGVTAYFTLQKKNAAGKWADVETVEKTEKDNFEVTFSKLDKNGTYRIVESVKGYEAEYMEYNEETGVVEIKDHKNTDNPDKLNPSEPKVVTGGKRFVKTNADGSERLIGAGFVIENQNEGDADKGKFLKVNNDNDEASQAYATAQKAYEDAINAVNTALANGEISADNKATIEGVEYDTKASAEAKIAELKITRDDAFKEAKLNYEWVDEGQATTFYTNEKGQFEVTGLAYGHYRAKETQKPAGYALPTDGGNFTFEVKKGSYSTDDVDIEYEKDDKEDSAKQIVNNKVTIPQTGGIGSLIFVVAGLAIMAGAYVAYRKNQARA